MSDTIRIPRPKFARRPDGPSGRAEHDSRGNAVWKRTRATDVAETPDPSPLSLAEDVPPESAGKAKSKR